MSPTLPHPIRKAPETLLDYETHSLLMYAMTSGIRDHMMISLALTTGLRNSELCNLTIECIRAYETITNILMLPGTIAKGGFSRDLPLRPDTREDLAGFLEWKELQQENLSPTAPLFVSKFTHKKLSPRDIQRIVGKISSLSIGRTIHPHILRHTFATRLLRVSNLRIVQQALGHKNIQTTQIYLHPSNDDMSEAFNKL